MTRKCEFKELKVESIASRGILRAGVQRALCARRRALRAALLVAGFAGAIPLAQGAPFPPIFPLSSLYPAHGGDGSRGFVLTGIDAYDYSGYSVSAAGDVNGDGVGDLIVGAPGAAPGGDFHSGESYVVFGSTAGFPAVVLLESLYPAGGGDGTRGFVLTGIDGDDESGYSVSAAGDVNGDGTDDLIVGAKGANPAGHSFAGESYVVLGSTAGFPAVMPLMSLYPAGGGDGTRGFVLTGIDGFDNSGRSVSAAGDVNGDGVSDLIIGAPGAAPGGDSASGESYVVFGSTTGFPAIVPLWSLYPAGGGDGTRGFVLTGIEFTDLSGYSVSAAGDVNGDGAGDLIVGAPGAEPGGDAGAGASYVVFGSTTGFPAVVPLESLYPAGGGDGSRGFVLTGIDVLDSSGYSVSGAGDVNGDGVDDLIVGARFADPGGDVAAGESYLVFGSTAGFPAVMPLASLYPALGGDGTRGVVLSGIGISQSHTGAAVSGAGDINADGVDDFIIGAPDAFIGGDNGAGVSYVVFGSTAGFPPIMPLKNLKPALGGDGTRGFVVAGIDFVDYSGYAVSAAGDVNGDGVADLIVGARGADPGGDSDAGESYVVFGRGSAR